MASCWKSFSPKKARQRPAMREQLGDDRCDADEVARAGRPFEAVGERPRARPRSRAPLRVHLARGRRKDQVDTRSLVLSRGPLEVRRVLRPGPRLNRTGAGSRRCSSRRRRNVETAARKQRQVPLVQSAHRRDEPERGPPGERTSVVNLRNPSREVTTSTDSSRSIPRTRSGQGRVGAILRPTWPAGRGRFCRRRKTTSEVDARVVAFELAGCSTWRCRSIVARSPRAAGPVSAPVGPRSSTSSRAPRASGRNASSGRPTPLRRARTCPSKRHEVIRGDTGSRVVPALWSVAITSGSAAERERQVCGELVAGHDEIATRAQATAPMTGSGRVASGWREATRSCGASTSSPSAPEQWTTAVKVPAGRLQRHRNRPSGTVIRGRRHPSAAAEGSSSRPRTSVTSMPTAPKAPFERPPGSAGPDDANLRHGELVSFRPFTGAVRVSTASSVPTSRRSSDTGPARRGARRQSGGTSAGSRSSSGASTKPRSAIRGCGTTRSGSEIRRSPMSRTSTSKVRGPLRTVRTRPPIASIAAQRRDLAARRDRSRGRTTQFRYWSLAAGPPSGADS